MEKRHLKNGAAGHDQNDQRRTAETQRIARGMAESTVITTSAKQPPIGKLVDDAMVAIKPSRSSRQMERARFEGSASFGYRRQHGWAGNFPVFERLGADGLTALHPHPRLEVAARIIRHRLAVGLIVAQFDLLG
jgi:hypothetical protein